MITRHIFLLFTFTLTLSIAGFSQNTLIVPDEGWRLWPDTAATWENDDIFLPDEVNLSRLPVTPPSGGWQILNSNTGISVQLPATVEQYFWGEFGLRPYQEAYYFEREDTGVKNGNYLGVSWWWRQINIPENYQNKKVLLHIRGARLRAEVYLNQQLVGYHIITETAFICDVSEAIHPGGKNILAIRITNPGGRLDWVDTQYMTWGKYRFHASHGFGGLDGGIYFTAHDPVFFRDLWVANRPEIKSVWVNLEVQNESQQEIAGSLTYELIDSDQDNKTCLSHKTEISIPKNSGLKIKHDLTYPDARLWNVENPKLYKLKLTFKSNSAEAWKDERNMTVGFRWFEADGVGEDAILRLNGERIRLISAISWGFWGINGLWPTAELAVKEVMAAKAFGMNCIQFHRNIGKWQVLEAQDRLGLLRYMEPGGGQTVLGEEYSLYAESPTGPLDISGEGGDAKTFAEKYMEEKIIRMIRDHRHHPSLLMYAIQNEIHPDLKNPRIFHVIRRMQAEDPSRIIMLKSGIPPSNQVWVRPYSDSIYTDRGDGYSGWWDRHTVGGPGVWKDAMYISPTDFTHYSANDSEIVVWGEMLGAAVPDNHSGMIETITQMDGSSYDLQDHRQILEAYQHFLDTWGFRTAFKTETDLFLDIGDKCYDFWGRVIETARLAESNDFLVISGWESTAIENHSGLVDNLRGFKGNPALLKDRFAAVRPVIRGRSLVLSTGVSDSLDLFFLNESNRAIKGKLVLRLTTPDGRIRTLGKFEIPAWEKDHFVYPIAQKVILPPFKSEGKYRLRLESENHPDIFAEENVRVVNPYPERKKTCRVGVLTQEPESIVLLDQFPGIQAEPYQKSKNYDLLLANIRLLHGWRSVVDSTREIAGTDDDILYHTESWGYWRNLEYIFTGLPKGPAKVTLRLAEVTLKSPGDRVMNVAINGDTVLKDFDIVATAGGPNIALDTAFTVIAPEGIIRITVPKLTVNYAKFSALKIEAGDTVIAINCGGEQPYTDRDGLVWGIYSQQINLDEEVLNRVRSGTPLLLLPDGAEAVEAYAKTLAEADAFTYLGHVGNVRASWMGSWFFVREHPVFAGLPVNQAMKSEYQVPVSGSDGVMLAGDNVEVFVGYGRDHDRQIGAAAFTVTLDKGKVLFFSLPGMLSGLTDPSRGMQPVMLRRLLMNSVNYLTGE